MFIVLPKTRYELYFKKIPISQPAHIASYMRVAYGFIYAHRDKVLSDRLKGEPDGKPVFELCLASIRDSNCIDAHPALRIHHRANGCWGNQY
jgi:hypothetical protein